VDESIFSCRHPPGTVGRVDESKQRLLPEERQMADRLASEGHTVTSIPRSKKSRTPDADVCGHATEFKTLERNGTATPDNRIRNSLSKANGQGTHVIVDARAEPKATKDNAHVGVRKFVANEARDKSNGKLKGDQKAAVRVVGKDFDASYNQARLDKMRKEQTKGPQQVTQQGAQHTPPKRSYDTTKRDVDKGPRRGQGPAK
jgi:hypothetical protein